MADELLITGSNKRERYESLYPQLQALLSGEDDLIANMANVSAALKEGFGFFWVGFYRVLGDQLVLGPFQGPVASPASPMAKAVWNRLERGAGGGRPGCRPLPGSHRV